MPLKGKRFVPLLIACEKGHIGIVETSFKMVVQNPSKSTIRYSERAFFFFVYKVNVICSV